jgi:hypothetical protein
VQGNTKRGYHHQVYQQVIPVLASYEEPRSQIEIVSIEYDHQHQWLHAVHQILNKLDSCASPISKRRQEKESPQGNVAQACNMLIHVL